MLEWRLPTLDQTFTLRSSRLCVAYSKHHPNQYIRGMATELLEKLKTLHALEQHAQQPPAAGRCDGQQTFPTVVMPDGVLQALRARLRSGCFLALLFGRMRAEGGHVVTSISIPTQEEADHGHVRFEARSLEEALRHGNGDCIAVAVGTDLLPQPGPGDLHTFLQAKTLAPQCRLLAPRHFFCR